MELLKVLWAGIYLEPLIVQFRTLAVGFSEEPSKVLICRFYLEPKDSLARSAYGFWKNPTSSWRNQCKSDYYISVYTNICATE